MKIQLGAALIAAGLATCFALAGSHALARGGGGGGGGHGGGRGGYVVVTGVYGGYSAEEPLVETWFEADGAAPAAVDGEMSPGDVILQRDIRADAIVLQDPAQGSVKTLPVGTLLTKVLLYKDKTATVWCALGSPGKDWKGSPAFDCVSDEKSSGRLDARWIGKSGDKFLGYNTSTLDWKGGLPASAAYRKAEASERPTGRIGYAWCGGDGVNTPVRFEAVLKFGDEDWRRVGYCGLGAWVSESDLSTVDIHGVHITTKPGATHGSLSYHIVNPPVAGPLAVFEPGGPFLTQAQLDADIYTQHTERSVRAFIIVGEPDKHTGVVARDNTVYSVGVRPSITGVAASEVRDIKGDVIIARGQKLYGGVVAGALDRQMVWCAPAAANPGRSKVACIARIGRGFQVAPSWGPDMWATHRIELFGGQSFVTPLTVERRAVDFPETTMRFVFKGWKRKAVAVDEFLTTNGKEELIQHDALPIDDSGHAVLLVSGGKLLLSQSSDTNVATVEFVAG